MKFIKLVDGQYFSSEQYQEGLVNSFDSANFTVLEENMKKIASIRLDLPVIGHPGLLYTSHHHFVEEFNRLGLELDQSIDFYAIDSDRINETINYERPYVNQDFEIDEDDEDIQNILKYDMRQVVRFNLYTKSVK